MHKQLGGRAARPRNLVIAVCAMAIVGSFALTASAFAKAPTGDYAPFVQCPRFTKEVSKCIYSQTLSGEVTINKQKVPIEKTITLQGGTILNETTFTETFVGAINGETLSKTALNVPGGLTDLVNCTEIKGEGLFEKGVRAACKLIFENSVTGVTATAELAKPASAIGINTSNLANSEGVALSLPVKIHLENPFLGSECYVGSSSEPIIWNLTTGSTSPNPPNKSIKGKAGTTKFKDEFNFVEITNNSLVDNAWSAPGASGCDGLASFLVDPVINAKIGLPAADGLNTTIFNNTVKEATAEAVIASEK